MIVKRKSRVSEEVFIKCVDDYLCLKAEYADGKFYVTARTQLGMVDTNSFNLVAISREAGEGWLTSDLKELHECLAPRSRGAYTMLLGMLVDVECRASS